MKKAVNKLTHQLLYLFTITLFVFLFVGGSTDNISHVNKELWQSGHLVLFAGLIYLSLQHALFRHKSILFKTIFTISFCLFFGLITEVAQQLVGRNFELKDIFNDLLGGCIGLLIQLYREQKSHFRKNLYWVLGLLLCLFGTYPFLLAIYDQWQINNDFPILANFNHSNDLQRWNTSHTQISISKKIKNKNTHSMKIDFLPYQYPNVTLFNFKQQWKTFNKLNFSIYNQYQQPVVINLKIYDRKHQYNGYQYDDRFNKTLTIVPGWNTIQQSLKEIKNSPQNRQMNMQEIASFSLFMENPKEPITVYINHLFLSKTLD